MSEFRQDLISGDWVIIAPGRAARPKFLDEKRPARKPGPKATCPFEHPEKNGNWPPILAYPSEKKWELIALPNKYPALDEHGKSCSEIFRNGIYRMRTGVGEHTLIITRDHNKNFAELSPRLAAEVFAMFQELCERTAKDPCAIYAVPFFNWGPLAGASVWHPHYQFLATPIIPAHSRHSIESAAAYYKKNKKCARCEIIAFERKEKTRVIEENAEAIAIAPYASKSPFEISILPKRHRPYFYRTASREVAGVAALLQSVMRRLKKKANDPDLNVFIHEAPLDDKSHDYHHWHIEVLPRISIPAGFELSTGIYINTTAPEDAAKILR
jgi:UDPglucose--hexose-1-phosphate uridylyltransferase